MKGNRAINRNEEDQDGCRNREVLQYPEGLRIHPAGRRRQRRVRARFGCRTLRHAHTQRRAESVLRSGDRTRQDGSGESQVGLTDKRAVTLLRCGKPGVARRRVFYCTNARDQPTASVTHFLVKDDFAAPESFAELAVQDSACAAPEANTKAAASRMAFMKVSPCARVAESPRAARG